MQSVVEAEYIAGIQSKEILGAWREQSKQISQLRKQVDPYELKDLDINFENNVINGQQYASEDARGNFKQKDSLKRKIIRFDHDRAPKRLNSQMSDSFSAQVKKEYCNVTSTHITVESRGEFQLTLRPRRTIHPLNALTADNTTAGDNVAADTCSMSTVGANDGTDTCELENAIANLSPGNSGNGDESDDEKKNDKKELSQQFSNPINKFEEALNKLKVYIKTFEDWRNDNRKYITEHLVHAYNECEKVKGLQHCDIPSGVCHGIETKEFCEDVIRKFIVENNVTSDPNTIIAALLFHSMTCKKDNCSVPLCREIYASLREEISETDDMFSFGSEPGEVLLSNVSGFDTDDEGREKEIINFGSELGINYEKEIASGSFGRVYGAWIRSKNNSEAYMAVKKMAHNENQENVDVDQLVTILKDIGKGPYLLTPDLVISTSSRKLTYFIMEMGEITLASYLKKVVYVHSSTCSEKEHLGPCHSGLPVATCCLYFVQIAQAVQHLHQRDYTHGDIKSDNIMIMPGHKEVKLIDLDFLKKEETKKQCGTFGYVAPDIFPRYVGNVLKESDVFSATLLIPEMFFGTNMNYGNNCKDEYLDWLQKRNGALYNCLQKHNPNLAYIFKRGTDFDHKTRPSIATMIRCFKENSTMRNHVESDIRIPPLHDVRPPDRPPSPKQNTREQHHVKTIAKKVIQQWMNSVAKKLPARLPLKIPEGETAGSILYDSQSVPYDVNWLKEVESTDKKQNEDLELTHILE